MIYLKKSIFIEIKTSILFFYISQILKLVHNFCSVIYDFNWLGGNFVNQEAPEFMIALHPLLHKTILN